ncbi:hypothetical protein C8R46DRAFT_1034265 [Mycena filopes]|nr:hypothetical protein C8R46DRAFT_1034265 [Mycena filopes]
MPGPKKKHQKKNKKNKRTFNAQAGSLFMQLPPELRYEIYRCLFFSTRLVHADIGTSWLQQVLFAFEDPDTMLDKFANIPSSTLALIRHARISGDPLMLSWPEDDVYYRTSQALKLLPGLALDRLTVLGSRIPEVSYQTLSMLVRHGAGWKELYYLSHRSTVLAYKDDPEDWFGVVGDPDQYRYLRVPQPAGWQRALEARDGATSGASVVIYRANAPRRPGAVLDPTTRVAFAQTLPAGRNLRTYGTVEDDELMKDGERDKEILVIVKRGRGVDYAEKKGSPYLEDGDIREAMPNKTWKEIKTELRHADDDDDDDFFSDYEAEEEPSLEEKYNHVDEYVWPPLHFSNE